ncbi:MAG TPA: DUF998 domain-containing protein [Pseudoalteromonas prydzensis]|uniref:DUF998 domain-containing protein n=1 Tax=Pseudoalteromonas prydzensis TaxID=182141 RepID=A0A7V1GD50_9GAMM|nr:DUF998 domain-containing protein [Pseudoalteromonas prydzensis]HEA14887.1 DUF998 domain-containing protein [Pseudoalteromonas prydzensis]
MLSYLGLYSALIASIWIAVGVYIAGRCYPNYSHAKQFCSELGAVGSPTEKLSPIINNYPLGLLFCLFGWYVLQLENAPLLIALVGWLTISHGVATWFAGYFPMDGDPQTKTPTLSCRIHSWAGLVMLMSLLIAPILVAVSSYTSISFRLFSILCVCITCYFLVLLTQAFKQKGSVGTYQRLSYGVQLLWLSAFSLVL